MRWLNFGWTVLVFQVMGVFGATTSGLESGEHKVAIAASSKEPQLLSNTIKQWFHSVAARPAADGILTFEYMYFDLTDNPQLYQEIEKHHSRQQKMEYVSRLKNESQMTHHQSLAVAFTTDVPRDVKEEGTSTALAVNIMAAARSGHTYIITATIKAWEQNDTGGLDDRLTLRNTPIELSLGKAALLHFWAGTYRHKSDIEKKRIEILLVTLQPPIPLTTSHVSCVPPSTQTFKCTSGFMQLMQVLVHIQL
jgi:hypothetical protein